MKPSTHFASQSGAALITSLIFLTVLTILGMSTMGTSLLESRMAGNSRDRNMAFQAAEIGLRDAELYIRDSGRIVGLTEEDYDKTAGCTGQSGSNCNAQDCQLGLCYNGGTMSANGTQWYDSGNSIWLNEGNWRNAIQYSHSRAVSGTHGKKVVGGGALSRLDYNINCGQIPGSCNYSQPDMLPLVRSQPEYLIEPFQKDVGGSRFYYRITVHGYGMRSGTQVMLQEVYTP